MLRSIASALAPVARTAVRPARLASPSLRSFPRSFGTTVCRCNDKDAPPPPAPDTQDTEPRAEAASDPAPDAPENAAPAGESAAPKRAQSTASLDDILGAVSAVALPGSEAEPRGEERSFRDNQDRPSMRTLSRYAPREIVSENTHKLHVRASRNNTIITLTSPNGDPIVTASGGSVGFKHTQRSGYEAGYRAAFAVFDKINKFQEAWRIMHLEILWNGFGQGREAVFRALLSDNGSATKRLVSRMTDTTPIKVGGVRPKKRRML